MKICSADTILSLQKELSLVKEIHISKNNITNEFSNNAVLNKLNLAILLLTKQLKSGESYDLDYDNQFIASEKYDAKKDIKCIEGIFLGLLPLEKNTVYLENRKCNSNVKFNQENTLSRVYQMLNTNGIKIKRRDKGC